MKDFRYKLSPLPYEYDALEPVISKEIMTLHHDKHHLAYVNGANSALELLEKSRTGEVQINVKAVLRDLSFNLNGHILHDIFWNNMKRYSENNDIPEKLTKLLVANFGSVEAFKKEFEDAGKAVEASGWVMLVKDDSGNLLVTQVQNHNLLNLTGFTPILVNDVWEHAYYLDYMNDRGTYLQKWWNIVNWDDVVGRL